jgi:hypothetical protein
VVRKRKARNNQKATPKGVVFGNYVNATTDGVASSVNTIISKICYNGSNGGAIDTIVTNNYLGGTWI